MTSGRLGTKDPGQQFVPRSMWPSFAQNHFTFFNEEFKGLCDIPPVEGDDPWRRKGRPINLDGIVRRAARQRVHYIDNSMVTRYELTKLRQQSENNTIAMGRTLNEDMDILFKRIVELEEQNKDLRFMVSEILEAVGE